MMKLHTNDTENITTTVSPYGFRTLPSVIGVPIIIVTVCSIFVSSIVIIYLIRSKSKNFFKWKVIDRFSLYTVVYDLLFYAVQSAFGIHQRFGKYANINQLACSIYGVLTLEFAFAQIFLTITIAIYAFNLVIRSQNLPLGKWDVFILFPTIVIPLVELTTVAAFGKFSKNPVYCSIREERGFITFHFLQICLVTFLSFVIVITLYLIIWCYIKRQTKAINISFGQQSAVNSRRLAFKLSLFVLVHVIQFGANAIEGLWISVEEPPMGLRYASVIIGAAGGIMNVHVIQFGGNAIAGLWISVEEPPMGLRYASVIIGAAGGIMNGVVFLTVRKLPFSDNVMAS
ncbi:unnamed protein product [Mytilus edulis]|uniref:Uncharacterized protein n=1 Tax=Mytilus edulis TaxID=6550 RepID=A0A8S3TFP8_MYTED|nr:unnamed protein product [Mytilus edulis]